jgi:hypothetical protein
MMGPTIGGRKIRQMMSLTVNITQRITARRVLVTEILNAKANMTR